MVWNFTDDPEVYATQAGDLLLEQPVANTITLTVLDALRAGARTAGGPPLLAWYRDGERVTGAVSMTPPHGLLIAQLPAGSVAELVTELRERRVALPDVHGSVAYAQAFVDHWTADGAAGAEVMHRQRLFRLAAFEPPARQPAGRARVATAADLDVVMGWMADFQAEAEARPITPDPQVYRRRIELGLIWLWVDDTGRPVSIAGRNVKIAGMSRVGPVYTPPRERGHGYGTAVTAACTADALAAGAEHVLLFTDLANPTSNGIYQRLGYRPIENRMVVRLIG